MFDANRFASAEHVGIDGRVLVSHVGARCQWRIRRLHPHGLNHGHKRWSPVMDGEIDLLIIVAWLAFALDQQEAKLTAVSAQREVCESSRVGVVPACP